MMTRRKILFSLESRATYGYSRNVLRKMVNYNDLEVATLVTGGHLSDECGNSVDLIRKDGFPVTVAVRKDDVSAAVQAAINNVAGSSSISAGGGLIHTTSG